MNYMSIDEIMAAGVTNAEHLRNNTQQSYTDIIDGAEWLTYAGAVCNRLYVAGNSSIGLGTNSQDLMFVYRTLHAMWDLWREEGTLYGAINFIRIRWGGYTYSSVPEPENKFVYDVLLFQTGDIMLHIENVPTNFYSGTCKLGSLTYTKPTAASPYVSFYLQPDGSYTVAYEQISIPISYIYGYLVRDGKSVYTVADGALVPVELTPGTREVADKTLETSLWVGSGTPPRVTKDNGNARAYVVPLVAGREYTVTMLDASDRFRVATCAFNPREMVAVEERSGVRLLALLNEHEAGQSVTFTAGEYEYYLVVHVTATQQEPACSITYITSPLVNAFINNGAASVPDGSLLLGLTSPEVLYWHDSDAELPTLTAAITATPLPQYVISEPIYLTYKNIRGIQSVVVEEAGAPLYAVAFDDGEFMAYTDSWAATDTGMSGAMLAAITETQWKEAIAWVSSIKLRALLQTPLDAVTRVYFDFDTYGE